MNILNGIQNFLQFINDNWTAIIVIIGLLISICKKVMDFMNKSKEEQVCIAKEQIKEIVLKLVTDAEEDYQEWVQAGQIKRSQVIEQIFLMYPVLAKAVDQEAVIKFIDDTIDDALDIMREIFEQNVADFEIEEIEIETEAEFEVEIVEE